MWDSSIPRAGANPAEVTHYQSAEGDGRALPESSDSSRLRGLNAGLDAEHGRCHSMQTLNHSESDIAWIDESDLGCKQLTMR